MGPSIEMDLGALQAIKNKNIKKNALDIYVKNGNSMQSVVDSIEKKAGVWNKRYNRSLAALGCSSSVMGLNSLYSLFESYSGSSKVSLAAGLGMFFSGVSVLISSIKSRNYETVLNQLSDYSKMQN